MAKLKKKRYSIIARLRIYFFAGIVVLVPLGFTVYLTIFLISRIQSSYKIKVNFQNVFKGKMGKGITTILRGDG